MFLCFVTSQYDLSDTCRRELDWADELKKPIIVIMLEDLQISTLKKIGFYIKPLLRINYFNDKNKIMILEQILKVKKFFQTFMYTEN